MSDTATRNLDGTASEISAPQQQATLLTLADDLEAKLKKTPKAGPFFGNVVHRGSDSGEMAEAYLTEARTWFDEVVSLTEQIRAIPSHVTIRVAQWDLNPEAVLAMVVQGQRTVRMEAFREILKIRRAR